MSCHPPRPFSVFRAGPSSREESRPVAGRSLRPAARDLRVPAGLKSGHETFGWLDRLGLNRPELRAWALYDWANSAFVTVVVTAVFPIFFQKVACQGLEPARAVVLFALTTTISMGLAAVLSPFLGALADACGLRKRLLARFMGLAVLCTAGMALLSPGQWKLAGLLFILANLGASLSFVFYDALLPHVARPEEVDRVSAAGYALGYLGGGLLLALNLTWISHPHWFGLVSPAAATSLTFLSVALWWVMFSVPMFRRVSEPRPRSPAPPSLGLVLGQLAGTLRELRRYRQAWLMMLAFMIYNDGVGTIIRRAVLGALALYVVVTVVAFRVRTSQDFYLLAAMVGLVQGGSQALSRSLFASLIPKTRTAEFFAFFGVCEKFAGLLGPATIAVMVDWTGSTRVALLAVNAFFLVGGWLLARVDVEAGRRAVSEDPAAGL
ncbi:MFS transporter [bacterium CPR1]|nr:MFS transporter [bacterium CPR1]